MSVIKKIKNIANCFIFISLSQFFTYYADAKNLNIITTIKPVASLVANITHQTDDKVDVMVDSYQSPHDFALKPSQIKKIYHADIVFYISPNFENFLNRIVDHPPKNVNLLSLSENKKIKLLKNRDFNDKHSTHHIINAKHSDSLLDYHIWLSPRNAIAMLEKITLTLSETNPQNKHIYRKNLKQTIDKINSLNQTIIDTLKPIKNTSFITFHDGYQYFDRHYGLKIRDVITLHPNQSPTIQHITDVRNKIKKYNIACIFKEPQYSDKIIYRIIDNQKIKILTLDDLGTGLVLDRNLYFKVLSNISKEIAKCIE